MDKDDVTLYGLDDELAHQLALKSEQRQLNQRSCGTLLDATYYEHKLKGEQCS